jgi:hypothetical protein
MSDADEVVRLRDENAYLRSLLQDLVDSLAPFLPLMERLDEYSQRRNGETGRRRTPPTS